MSRLAGSDTSLRCGPCREHVLEYNTTAVINFPSFEADHGEVQYACIAKLKPGETQLDPLPNRNLLRDLMTDTLSNAEKL